MSDSGFTVQHDPEVSKVSHYLHDEMDMVVQRTQRGWNIIRPGYEQVDLTNGEMADLCNALVLLRAPFPGYGGVPR